MPTGYTADIYNGKCNDAKDFIKKAADAFIGAGRFGEMQDEVDYYLESLEELQTDLKYFENTKSTVEDYEKEKLRHETWNKNYEEEKKELSDKYDAFMRAISLWEVPEKLTHLKEFCLHQLELSKEYDCNVGTTIPFPTTPSEWFEREMKEKKRKIEYYTNQLKLAEERVKNIREFQRLINDSLVGFNGKI